MTNIKRESDTKEIINLIDNIDKDKICLPDFQREFIWKPNQLAKLIESVVRQYPIGTLIFLNANSNHKFKPRSFRGANPETIHPDFFVIDGQQRLNTFYLLLRRPNKFEPFDPIEYKSKNYKFFLKISTHIENLPDEVDKPQFVISERIEKEEKKDYEWQGKKRLIPVEFILYEEYTNQWIKKALGHLQKKTRETYRKNIINVRKIIEKYTCFIEIIKSELKPQDHYNIFELLNEAGTDLTIFDLLVAKLNSIDIKLRDLWKDSQIKYPEIKKYDLDPKYILKTISLIRGTKRDEDVEKPTCANSDLLKLYKEYEHKNGKKEFQEDWDEACKYIEKAIKEMRNSYGVYNKKYIPYSPMIITLATIIWWFEKYKKYQQRFKPKMKNRIKKWYWGSILYNVYDTATDTNISDHYLDLRNWVCAQPHKKIPYKLNFQFSKKKILDILNKIDSSADARYKAIISIPLMDYRAKDIYSNDFLVDATLHDHHIFPDRFLKDIGIDDRELINNIANRMLITDKTNQEIKKRNPQEYLKQVDSKILKNHFFISKSVICSNKKLKEIYTEFCADRKERICDFLYEYLNE